MPRRDSAPLWREHEQWHARLDVRGQWRVVNAEGKEPLRDSDPVARMRAAYLVAAAPLLLAVAEAVSSRLARIATDHGLSARDSMLAREALCSLAAARPPIEEVIRGAGRLQLELSLDAGEVNEAKRGSEQGRRRA